MQNLHEFLKKTESHALPIAEQKKVLRKQLITKREQSHRYADPKNWGPKQFYRALELLKINKIEDLKNKYLVACFFPIKDELNLSSFASNQWLFPYMSTNKELLWFEYGDGKTDYTVNKYGVKEKEEKFCFKYTQDFLPLLCFVPGLAAAQDGTRLGYGGGFYDKFLREFKEKITSVLCLPSKEFLFNSLPSDDYDEKVDLIVF